MRFYEEVDGVIWRNFYVDHLSYITTDFELKFRNRSGLELNLNSKEI
jgi:hypothetical protein